MASGRRKPAEGSASGGGRASLSRLTPAARLISPLTRAPFPLPRPRGGLTLWLEPPSPPEITSHVVRPAAGHAPPGATVCDDVPPVRHLGGMGGHLLPVPDEPTVLR